MQVKLLEQRHPGHDLEDLKQLRALAEGGKAWRSLVNVWIPANVNEPTAMYADRCNRAVYHNYSGSILSIIQAYLFSDSVRITGFDGDYYTALFENCDRTGTDWSAWWAQRFHDAIIGRRAYAWVNLPSRDGVSVDNRASEEKAGLLDAYLVGIGPEEVLDWGEDSTGALSWIHFRQIVESREDIEQPRKTVWRWVRIDATTIRRWEWTATEAKPAPTDEDQANESPAVLHNIGKLPVVRIELTKELWAMELLRDPALAHLRSRNDLAWKLHKTAHAMPIIKRKWGGDAVKVGTGYSIELEPGDEFDWSEPPGNSTAIMRDDCKDLKEEIFRVVHQMALSVTNDSSRQAASGASKDADWQASDVVLAAYASLVLAAMTRVCILVGLARGDVLTPVVAGLDSWREEDLMTWLTATGLALEGKQASPTFKRLIAVRQAQRLLPDASEADLDAITKEIEASAQEEQVSMGDGGAITGVVGTNALDALKEVSAKTLAPGAAEIFLVAMCGWDPAQAKKAVAEADKHEPPAPDPIIVPGGPAAFGRKPKIPGAKKPPFPVK